MLINIINLKRRKDRRDSLIDHLYDMKCNYQFWEGFDDRTQLGFKNIIRSHKRIVQYAKDNKIPCTVIAEDDLRFSSKNSIKYFIDNIPEKYDMYFGMIYTGNIQDGRITHGFSGLQFYMIHENFYNVFLSAPDGKHLDIWLGQKCHEYLYYCCDPFICYGASGYSDNFKWQWTFDENKLPRTLLRDDV